MPRKTVKKPEPQPDVKAPEEEVIYEDEDHDVFMALQRQLIPILVMQGQYSYARGMVLELQLHKVNIGDMLLVTEITGNRRTVTVLRKDSAGVEAADENSYISLNHNTLVTKIVRIKKAEEISTASILKGLKGKV